MPAAPITPETLARRIAAQLQPGRPAILGITGSVAAGKSTLAGQIAETLGPTHRVEILSTDGFLFPNAVLDPRGLSMRKGFPETYDISRLAETLVAARHGPVSVPGYSHSRYDIDPDLTRRIDRPDLLLVEGLGFAPVDEDRSVADALDSLLYLDAAEDDLEHWFLTRFMALWHAAGTDPASFYARFLPLGEEGAREFARTVVWEGINLPNLREHIIYARPLADIVVGKARDHSLSLIRPS